MTSNNTSKKHISTDHCRDIPNNILSFKNKWNRVSGIYKITFLPFRLFTYYGSSPLSPTVRTDLGMRFKYHYYNGAKQRNFLGLFIKTLVGKILQSQLLKFVQKIT